MEVKSQISEMMYTTLSIVIPAYNAERYIAPCLDSILAQSFTDYEVIVVDDGSKDNTYSVGMEYVKKDARIKIIHKKNSGVSVARNIGIACAKGKFITFIDIDDTINANFLSNFSFDESLDIEIQGFVMNFIGNESKNYSVQPKATRISTIKDVYSESECLRLTRGPVCKLYKREIIEKNNIIFPIGLSFGEDAIFVKRYLLHCIGNARAIAADDYSYNHTENSTSLTSRRQDSQKFYAYIVEDLSLYHQLEKNWGRFDNVVRDFFIRERCLEFYWSIILCVKDEKLTRTEKIMYIKNAQRNEFKVLKRYKALPNTYKMIKFVMNSCSANVSLGILKLMFI